MAHHPTLEERELLYRLLKKGRSKTEIADVMGRDRSTIHRELSRNTRRGGYEPGLAQRLADRRRLACRRPRKLDDAPGPAYSEMHLYSVKGRTSRPFVTGKERVLFPEWRPDGSAIAFLARRGEKAKTQAWMIPLAGGESTQLTDAPDGVLAFRWHPSGSRVGYIAQESKTVRERALEEKGYGFIYYEENLRNRNLYMIGVSEGEKPSASQITKETNVWSFEFSPDGKTAAVAASPKNLIDQSYLFQQIFLLDFFIGLLILG